MRGRFGEIGPIGKARFRVKHFCFLIDVIDSKETRNFKVAAMKGECWKKEIEEAMA